ncbi:MAG: hypothetical protein ACRD2B_12640 [Terriglobia bacterium]
MQLLQISESTRESAERSKRFDLSRIPGCVKEAICRNPGQWVEFGTQRVRFVDGIAEIQSLIPCATPNAFLLR